MLDEQLMRSATTSLLHPSANINNTFHHPSTSHDIQTQTNLFHSPKISFNYNSNSINFHQLIHSSWTNHEILALFNITSTIHNFFPPDQLITWDHVSSKLAELGIKKSAQNCKEKFEHENTSINNFTGFVSDEKENTQQCDDDDDKVMMIEKSKNKKRKRRRGRFEMLKSFCEKVVDKVIAQQEEIHNKLLEDMLKRDEEKLAREEEWKKQEIERMNKMAQQQVIASERQSNIIEFLNKYSSSQLHSQNPSNNLESTTPCSNVIADQNPSSSDTNSTSTLVLPTIMEKRRWPRDEVLALINLKSTTTVLNKSNNKGPLWERICEGMSELGYKRSAKRCKEKWENINKYFKKTKDGIGVNKKKRSLDSRTCPYFHQLTSLYNQQQQH